MSAVVSALRQSTQSMFIQQRGDAVEFQSLSESAACMTHRKSVCKIRISSKCAWARQRDWTKMWRKHMWAIENAGSTKSNSVQLWLIIERKLGEFSQNHSSSGERCRMSAWCKASAILAIRLAHCTCVFRWARLSEITNKTHEKLFWFDSSISAFVLFTHQELLHFGDVNSTETGTLWMSSRRMTEFALRLCVKTAQNYFRTRTRFDEFVEGNKWELMEISQVAGWKEKCCSMSSRSWQILIQIKTSQRS